MRVPVLQSEQFDFVKGEVLLVNKPIDWTSFDVVKKLRYATYGAKIGHAGTLDPRATGLLILCTGKKTKIIETIQQGEKEYVAVVKLGFTTASYDTEHPEENPKEIPELSGEQLEKVLDKFRGEFMQAAPVFSALKKEGKPMYLAAREGKAVKPKVRPVFIKELELLSFEGALLKIRVACGKGTYIRSLAHDIGQELGCGAYLHDLQRTRIGSYQLEDAWELDDLVAELRRLGEEHKRKFRKPKDNQ